jgi:hypothetical protein
MKTKPLFIRTIDPEHFNDLDFDVSVIHISSRQKYSSDISMITVDGRQHYVFTAELKEVVSLPGSLL